MKNNASAKTRQEIAHYLGISYSTLYRRLKKSDLELSSGLLTPEEVKMVYQALGFPVPEGYRNIHTHTSHGSKDGSHRVD